MMDEQLIEEVAQHNVIFNRQKYYLNGNGSTTTMGKYETKDEAWQIIAMKLRSDVETCKKRWKYLRERYVSQRKQGDPPVYEHLSRPYLEKMKFLDQHIQPRKSYRNVPSFLTSPHSANSSYNGDYNMDTKSNSSLKSLNHYGNNHPYVPDNNTTNNISGMENANGHVKIEADQMFRDFAAAVANQQIQQQAAAVAAAIADSSQTYNNNATTTTNGLNTSTNTSLKSPLSSPLNNTTNVQNNTATTATTQSGPQVNTTTNAMNYETDVQAEELDSSAGSNFNTKKPRVQLPTVVHHNGHHNNSNAHFGATDTDDDSDSSSLLQPQTLLQETTTQNAQTSNFNTNVVPRNLNNQNNQNQNMFPSNADFLFQLYQQLPQQQQQQQQQSQQQQQQQQPQQQPSNYKFSTIQNNSLERSSEQLLGELVTTELLKMSKERRKHVQKRILEILFFDD